MFLLVVWGGSNQCPNSFNYIDLFPSKRCSLLEHKSFKSIYANFSAGKKNILILIGADSIENGPTADLSWIREKKGRPYIIYCWQYHGVYGHRATRVCRYSTTTTKKKKKLNRRGDSAQVHSDCTAYDETHWSIEFHKKWYFFPHIYRLRWMSIRHDAKGKKFSQRKCVIYAVWWRIRIRCSHPVWPCRVFIGSVQYI